MQNQFNNRPATGNRSKNNFLSFTSLKMPKHVHLIFKKMIRI